MPVKELVVHLGRHAASGELTLQRGAVEKRISLMGGRVVNASSNQAREYLGQFLINMGHVSEDQLLEAFREQRETGVYLGRILARTGLVTEEVVRDAIGLKLRETLLDVFTWEDGEFSYDPRSAPPSVEGVEVSLELLDVEREAEFRETAWSAIRAVFPRGSLTLSLDPERLPDAQPGTLDARLIELVREGQTIDEMLLTLHATDFFLYQRLYALYRMEALRPADAPAPLPERAPLPTMVGEALGAGAIAEHARSFLENGNAAEAEALARQAYELTSNPEHGELLRRAELALAEALRGELLERPQVPVLAVPLATVKTMKRSAAEKYLLSRMDGSRDLSALLKVSPLQELEALKLVRGFLESGLVRLQDA